MNRTFDKRKKTDSSRIETQLESQAARDTERSGLGVASSEFEFGSINVYPPNKQPDLSSLRSEYDNSSHRNPTDGLDPQRKLSARGFTSAIQAN